MDTETASRRYRGLDLWSGLEILRAAHESQLAAVAAVGPALRAIEAAAAEAAARLKQTGRLVYLGAGSSGHIAMQDALELRPTFAWPPERLVMLIAGGAAARFGPVEHAEDDAAAGAADVDEVAIDRSDVVIGVAASGTTAYSCAALARARARGALAIGVANHPGTPLLAAADHPILLETGPELVAGSTRLAAGTAQKVALNLLSTLVMIKLGRVLDGYMVNIQPANEKLKERGCRILMELTGAEAGAARAALERCADQIKPAYLVLSS